MWQREREMMGKGSDVSVIASRVPKTAESVHQGGTLSAVLCVHLPLKLSSFNGNQPRFSRFSCGVCCVLHTSAEQKREGESERVENQKEGIQVDSSHSTETIYLASKVANCECRFHLSLISRNSLKRLCCPPQSHFQNSEVRWKSDFITDGRRECVRVC